MSLATEHFIPTSGPDAGHRILTHTNVWSADSEWLVYDIRSDAAGDRFDGNRVERVRITTGETEVLYQSQHGACCGVATWLPNSDSVVFILGPEYPTADWTYGPSRRQGVIVDVNRPGVIQNLDARDLIAPFTEGALRGGTHLHLGHPTLPLVSFTYEDETLARKPTGGERNQRNLGVTQLHTPVSVPRGPRQHDAIGYSVVLTKTKDAPCPGSDEISRACEEAWIGSSRSLAFQGEVMTTSGESRREVFRIDVPEDLNTATPGTTLTRPTPPTGCVQTRLTFGDTGLALFPRHWLRSRADGEEIGFLRTDETGVVQFWTISPKGRAETQVSCFGRGVQSAFTWHPTRPWASMIADGRVCILDSETRVATWLTPARDGLRAEACVFSPDGQRIAYIQRQHDQNRICYIQLNGD
ncbi:MAG: DUF3748 domain-containing protein [Fimbriiglobus sp.]